jgi:hypothetical protein
MEAMRSRAALLRELESVVETVTDERHAWAPVAVRRRLVGRDADRRSIGWRPFHPPAISKVRRPLIVAPA